MASFFASARVAVSGLSQITWMPRRRNCIATGACMWFGRDDGDGVDAVLAARLAAGHVGKAVIAARRVKPEVGARGLRLLGAGGKAAGDQFVLVVDPGGDAVDGADEGVASAADHAKAQAGARRCGQRRWPWSSLVILCRKYPGGRGLAPAPQVSPVPACGGWRRGRCRPPAKSSKAFSVTRMMWARDEIGPFAGAVLGVLQAAFPFDHRPAVKAVLRELGEDAAEIDLPVAEASGSARRGSPRTGSRHRRPAARSGSARRP